MSVVKDEVRKMLDHLPESATWDDVMYQLYVRQKIERSLEQADRGELIPHDEVEKRVLGE